MLKLLDSAGNDLAAFSPEAVVLAAASDISGAPFTVAVTVIEDSGTLPVVAVNGTVDWHDGTLPEVFPYTSSSAGTLTIESTRSLANGNHSVSVTGYNYRAPVPDVVHANFNVTVEAASTSATPDKLIYGPVLPRDSGYPNPSQWSFNTGYDVGVLESSLKMLLSTARGERIMQPEYGTDLRALLFEHQQPGFEAAVQEEIVQAVTRWEPRVTFAALSVRKTSSTSVTVEATFMSKLTSAVFSTSLTFQP